MYNLSIILATKLVSSIRIAFLKCMDSWQNLSSDSPLNYSYTWEMGNSAFWERIVTAAGLGNLSVRYRIPEKLLKLRLMGESINLRYHKPTFTDLRNLMRNLSTISLACLIYFIVHRRAKLLGPKLK